MVYTMKAKIIIILLLLIKVLKYIIIDIWVFKLLFFDKLVSIEIKMLIKIYFIDFW